MRLLESIKCAAIVHHFHKVELLRRIYHLRADVLQVSLVPGVFNPGKTTVVVDEDNQ